MFASNISVMLLLEETCGKSHSQPFDYLRLLVIKFGTLTSEGALHQQMLLMQQSRALAAAVVANGNGNGNGKDAAAAAAPPAVKRIKLRYASCSLKRSLIAPIIGNHQCSSQPVSPQSNIDWVGLVFGN